MNAIIIDDNAAAANELRRQLEPYTDITVVGMASNGFDGLALADEKKPNVMFLDVEMPDVSGLDFLDRVSWAKDGRCKIVMYTAHDRFILSAMRRRAFDVLLKPIDPKELEAIVERLRTEGPTTKAEEDKQTNPNMILLWTNAVDFRLVNKNDIGLFSYNHVQRSWEARLGSSDKPIRIRRSLKSDDLLRLDPQFVQVSQKHIINMNYLIEVVDGVCRFLPPFDQVDDVTVGRTFRKKLTDHFLNL